jgi:hypothetical protein
MSGTSAFLLDHVASLLPNTTAGACVTPQTWTETRHSSGPTWYCSSQRTCHTSCDGRSVCGGWVEISCMA